LHKVLDLGKETLGGKGTRNCCGWFSGAPNKDTEKITGWVSRKPKRQHDKSNEAHDKWTLTQEKKRCDKTTWLKGYLAGGFVLEGVESQKRKRNAQRASLPSNKGKLESG